MSTTSTSSKKSKSITGTAVGSWAFRNEDAEAEQEAAAAATAIGKRNRMPSLSHWKNCKTDPSITRKYSISHLLDVYCGNIPPPPGMFIKAAPPKIFPNPSRRLTLLREYQNEGENKLETPNHQIGRFGKYSKTKPTRFQIQPSQPYSITRRSPPSTFRLHALEDMSNSQPKMMPSSQQIKQLMPIDSDGANDKDMKRKSSGQWKSQTDVSKHYERLFTSFSSLGCTYQQHMNFQSQPIPTLSKNWDRSSTATSFSSVDCNDLQHMKNFQSQRIPILSKTEDRSSTATSLSSVDCNELQPTKNFQPQPFFSKNWDRSSTAMSFGSVGFNENGKGKNKQWHSQPVPKNWDGLFKKPLSRAGNGQFDDDRFLITRPSSTFSISLN